MTRYGRDPEETWKALVIAFCHPDFEDERPINVLAKLRGHEPVVSDE